MADVQITAVDLLEKARSLIEDERNWVQGRYGAGMDHGPWCAVGALWRARRLTGAPLSIAGDSEDALRAAVPPSWRGDLERYNDSRTHRTVLKLYDAALAKVKGQGNAS